MDRRSSSNRKFALGTAAGVLVGGLLTVGALGLIPKQATTKAVPSPSRTASAAASSAAPATPSAFPTLTQSGMPSGTPTPSGTPATGGLATPAKGSWFAMVRWMSKSRFSQSEAEDYAASQSQGGQPLVVLDTDAVNLRGGKTGQWAVGVIGLRDMNDATAACRAMGLTPGGQCGRFEIA